MSELPAPPFPKGGPTPEDWIEVLTNPTIGPVVAARFFGGGRNSGYRSCEIGDYQAFKVGGKWRVPTEPLLQKVGLTTAEARESILRRALEASASHQNSGATSQVAA